MNCKLFNKEQLYHVGICFVAPPHEIVTVFVQIYDLAYKRDSTLSNEE